MSKEKEKGQIHLLHYNNNKRFRINILEVSMLLLLLLFEIIVIENEIDLFFINF